jgi:hypothetical protein
MTNSRNVNIQSVSSMWKCEGCKTESIFSFTDVADVGVPICFNDECENEGDDMTPEYAIIYEDHTED